MLLATILLLYPFPQSGDAVKAVTERSASVSVEAAKDSSLSDSLPSVPTPKIKTDSEVAAAANPASIAPGLGGAPVEPASGPLSIRPGRPGFNREDAALRRNKKIWVALTVASSGAASFDAWSTRRAISGGYGTESNPLLAPFAHSKALYAATQVSPAVMDFVGRKMMTSEYPLLRKLWWLPQTAGTGVSLFAGVHNVGVVPSH